METKVQQSRGQMGPQESCGLVTFYFLWNILQVCVDSNICLPQGVIWSRFEALVAKLSDLSTKANEYTKGQLSQSFHFPPCAVYLYELAAGELKL